MKSGRPGPGRQPRPAQCLFHPAAEPGRPARLRQGRRQRTGQRQARDRRRRRAVINLCRRVRPADVGRSRRGRGERRQRPRARQAAPRWCTSRQSAPIPNSRRMYGRTKAEGEAAVRKAFPKCDDRPPVAGVRARGSTSPTASPAMAQLPFLPVIAARRALPAGLCPRPRAGDRRGGARSAGRMAARSTKSAARSVLTMVELHQAILAITGQKPRDRPVARPVREPAVALRLAARARR